MSSTRSKKRKFDPYLVKRLFEEIAENEGKTCGSSDSKDLAINISEEVKGLSEDYAPIGPLYIYNGVAFCENAIKGGKEVGFSESHLNSIAYYLGFEGIDEYLGNQDQVETPAKNKKPGFTVRPPYYTPKLNTYFIQARFIPGMFISIPILFLSKELKDLMNIPIEYGLAILVVIFGLSGIIGGQISSIISKVFQNQLFTKKKGFPSAYFMLYAHPKYPNDVKDQYRYKVSELFGLKLLTQSEEKDQPIEAINRLKLSTEGLVSVVNSQKLFAANLRYGLARNMLGASLITLPLALAGFILGYLNNNSIQMLGLGLWGGFSLILLLFWRPLLRSSAESYAQQLLFEFMNRAVEV